MRGIFIFCVLGLSLLAGGCFSVDTARAPGPGDHMLVSNYGWYLFNCVPLVTGNSDEPVPGDSQPPWVFFRDDVTMDKIQARFMRRARELHKTPYDLVWNNYDTVLLTIPGLQVPIPIPYLLCYREMQLSGGLK